MPRMSKKLQDDLDDGKSKLMLSIATPLSKGEPLPFTVAEETEPMTIIYQTTEDNTDDMVVLRFNFADGNRENLIFIKKNEKSLSFEDNRITKAIENYHVKLLILDPMSLYIGEGCSMNNINEIRAEFNYLIAVAKDTGGVIVIITYVNKMKGASTNGLIDFAGAARSILAIICTLNKEAPTERCMVQVKFNPAPIGSAMVFEIVEKEVDFISEADIVYMARMLLADPFLPRKVIANKNEDIVRYFTCMAERAATRCCMVNPLIGRKIEGCEASIHLAHEGKKL